MKALLICGLIFFYSCNSMAAVLYAGVPVMDSGGFISFSPAIDCAFWGAIAAVSGIAMLALLVYHWRGGRMTLPKIPEPYRFGAGYLATLCDLSLIVLALGALGLLDRFGFAPWHIPFWGYVALLTVLYLGYGAFFGAIYPSRAWQSLLGGVLIAALFGLLGNSMLAHQAADEAYWSAQPYVTVVPAYTEILMDTTLGAILGRLNLPACVIMDAYAYAYFDNLGGCHDFSREVITRWVSIVPPLVFTVGHLAGSLLARGREKRKQHG